MTEKKCPKTFLIRAKNEKDFTRLIEGSKFSNFFDKCTDKVQIQGGGIRYTIQRKSKPRPRLSTIKQILADYDCALYEGNELEETIIKKVKLEVIKMENNLTFSEPLLPTALGPPIQEQKERTWSQGIEDKRSLKFEDCISQPKCLNEDFNLPNLSNHLLYDARPRGEDLNGGFTTFRKYFSSTHTVLSSVYSISQDFKYKRPENFLLQTKLNSEDQNLQNLSILWKSRQNKNLGSPPLPVDHLYFHSDLSSQERSTIEESSINRQEIAHIKASCHKEITSAKTLLNIKKEDVPFFSMLFFFSFSKLKDMTMETSKSIRIEGVATDEKDRGFGVSEAKNGDLISFMEDCIKSIDVNSVEKLSVELAACKKIEDKGLANFCYLISQNFKKLKKLKMNFPKGVAACTDTRINAMMKGLFCENLKSLETLSLFFGGCLDSNFVVIKLTEYIQTLRNLKGLSLNFSLCDRITDGGLKSLTDSFVHLTRLKKLKLIFWGCSNIQDAGIENLAKALVNTPQLTDLTLRFTISFKISDLSINQLGESISKNLKELKNLDLSFWGCNTTTEGKAKLVEHLKTMNLVYGVVEYLKYDKINGDGKATPEAAMLQIAFIFEIFWANRKLSETGDIEPNTAIRDEIMGKKLYDWNYRITPRCLEEEMKAGISEYCLRVGLPENLVNLMLEVIKTNPQIFGEANSFFSHWHSVISAIETSIDYWCLD